MALHSEDNRPVKLNATVAPDVIPMFAGRPRREKVIGRDDLMDLDILLHTCDTVDELIGKL